VTSSGPPRQISGRALRVDRIQPAHASWSDIQRFALTSNGYDHCGSLEACAALAEARQCDTLSNMRACLFYEQRKWRFMDAQPDAMAMSRIRELMALISERVRSANDLLA